MDWSDPFTAGFDDGDLAPKALANPFNDVDHALRPGFAGLVEERQDHEPGKANALAHDQLAEVVVFGDEHALKFLGEQSELDIVCAFEVLQGV